MSNYYPSRSLPLLTPPLEPVLGDIAIPRKILKKGGMQVGLRLRDIVGLNGSEFPGATLYELADFIIKNVQSHKSVLEEVVYPVSGVPQDFGELAELLGTSYTISDVALDFASLAPDLSVRTVNSLVEYGIKDADIMSGITLGELVGIRGLGAKGLLEILSTIYVKTSRIRVNHGDKLVISRNLKQIADVLSKKRWASNLYKNDPRMHDYIQNIIINPQDSTVKEIAETLKITPMSTSEAKIKKREVNRLISKADELNKLRLATEIVQIIDSIKSSERARAIIIERLGANGSEPQTLEAIGKTAGVTRERIRQIEADFLSRLAQRKNVWAPVFDKTISLVSRTCPIREKDLQKLLKKKKLIRGSYSVNALINIGKTLGRDIDIELDPRAGIVATEEFLEIVPRVIGVSLSLVTHWGAITIEQVKEALSSQGIKADDDRIIKALEYRRDFAWLDKKNGWFWLKNAQKNRVLNYVEKIMSVAGSIDLSELRNGTGRWHRVHGYRLPKKILLALCLSTGRYSFSDGRLQGDEKLRDWRLVLAEVESKIVEVLFENGYVMRRSDLEEKVVGAGVNRGSFYVYIGYSTVIERYAPGVYGLRGAPIKAAQIEALIPPQSRKGNIFRDNGWTEKGNLWIGYKISKASASSGVVSIPASLSKFITGSYRLITESGEPIGTLTTRNSNMWGLSPFFRRWGVEEGDFIIVEFDKENNKAKVTTGDEEIITRHQEQEIINPDNKLNQ